MPNFKTIAASVILASLYPAASFACSEWDFGRSLTIHQNNGPVITLSNFQRGRKNDGQTFKSAASYTRSNGKAEGQLDWDGRFVFYVWWDDGSIGRYTAHVDQQGAVVDGETRNQVKPQQESAWFTTDRIACRKP